MTQYLPQLITAIGALVVLVNIIVQVIKPFTKKFIDTNIVAVIVSMILTCVVCIAFWDYLDVPFAWYYVPAMIIIGFMVAYAAMFGFDKLKEALTDVGEKK